jgi:hypothetical protein
MAQLAERRSQLELLLQTAGSAHVHHRCQCPQAATAVAAAVLQCCFCCMLQVLPAAGGGAAAAATAAQLQLLSLATPAALPRAPATALAALVHMTTSTHTQTQSEKYCKRSYCSASTLRGPAS